MLLNHYVKCKIPDHTITYCYQFHHIPNLDNFLAIALVKISDQPVKILVQIPHYQIAVQQLLSSQVVTNHRSMSIYLYLTKNHRLQAILTALITGYYQWKPILKVYAPT